MYSMREKLGLLIVIVLFILVLFSALVSLIPAYLSSPEMVLPAIFIPGTS